MPYYVPASRLSIDSRPPATERLFVGLWLNLLESRVPALLGPQPFSVVGLLTSLHSQIEQRQLQWGTLSRHAAAILIALANSQWLCCCTTAFAAVRDSLRHFAGNPTASSADGCARAITALVEDLGSERIRSHLHYILTLPPDAMAQAAFETSDLISDLIDLGHSESFLYGWGRSSFVAAEPPEGTLRDRLETITLLGRSLRFSVVFEVGPVSWVPALPYLVVGKVVRKAFSTLDAIEVPDGRTLALVNVVAPDYKAAIENARNVFQDIAQRRIQTSRGKRMRITADRYFVKRDDTGEELEVADEALRPFEPPLIQYGVRTGYIASQAPALLEPLEQCFYWISSAARVRGEAQFVSLWLALISILGDDSPHKVAPLLAKYRVLAAIDTTVHWTLEYLRLACRFDTDLEQSLQGILSRWSSTEELMAGAASKIASVQQRSRILAALPAPDLLLSLRLGQLRDYMDRAGRVRSAQRQCNELLALLPVARTARHSIAHLAGISSTSLALLNRALSENVALVADQVAAAGLGNPGTTLTATHRQTDDDFEALAVRTIADPHMSIHHVRQGRCRWDRATDADTEATPH